MIKLILIPTMIFAFASCTPRQGADSSTSNGAPYEDTTSFVPPKNIILMIGDGMGLTQITAGMYANGNKLNLEQFLYIGLQKTHANDDLITDSAASATSLACGVKTNNGAVGVDKNNKPVRSIMEEAKESGKAVGLVATSSITHATPACFYAHQTNRGFMEAIAGDLIKSDVDFFVGGGKKYFERRKDERNLITELQSKGYVISGFIQKDFNDISINFSKNFGYFTSNEEPLPYLQGRDYLVAASKSATLFLSSHSKEGFFLMVEGSQIDWGGHANDSDYIISEMIEFDKAIGVILDFAKEDGETLIIVTADHETGGYAINPGSKMDSIRPAFTTDKHTGTLVPVFAYGPGARLFTGIYDNTTIYSKMRKAMGFIKT
jgi:alkaline phosphatase